MLNGIDSNVVDERMAPVVIFAYARADHLRRTVESLLVNPEAASTDVTFYCDAAKNPEHRRQVEEVRAYVDSVRGFNSITRVHRESNMGLALSVIAGVTDTLARTGRVIVVEDDLVVSSQFLGFMNEALQTYQDDCRVASIHGYSYPTRDSLPETFFLEGADCWGWATWSRAWATFDHDGSRLLKELRDRKLTRHFDFDGQYPYTQMLEDQVAGRNSSWAIRWYASCYLKGLLTLYPGRALVQNIGNDSSGTHRAAAAAFSRAVDPESSRLEVRTAVEPSSEARSAFERFFRESTPASTRARRWLRNSLQNFI